MLSLKLLGTPHIARDGAPLESLRRKNRALLFYVAEQRRPVSRDHLLAFFWPDHPRPAAQRILRTMLYDLRQQLGPAFEADGDALALSPETEVDSWRLEAALAANPVEPAALAAALDRVRGDFLEGFTLSDTPEFEDWAARRREHYRGLAMRGLAALAAQHESHGRYPQALAALNRALELDPLQEELQRACLRLHYWQGDRAGAIRRYETLRHRLDEELGVLPSPETRALYDALLTDSLPMPQPAAAPRPAGLPRARTSAPGLLPFAGRAAELETLREAAEAGQFILIEGEPGIGKTRLADEFIAAHVSRSPAALLLRGAAHESEQGLPYQPVMDALRGLLDQPDWPQLRAGLGLPPERLADAAHLLPELQAGLAPQPGPASFVDEARVWEGLNQLLQRLARQRPVVVFLDDIHWADAATAGLLGYLARRAASPSLLLLAAARPAGHDTRLGLLLPALAHENRLAHLVLEPLSPVDMRWVAERLSPAHGQPLSAWLERSAEGNPYFVNELVRLARHNGLLKPDGTLDRDGLAAAPMLPPTIHNLIRSRVIRLTTEARRALEVAAVVGREFDYALVQPAAGLAEAVVLDALDELRAAGLIQARGGERYAFDHSLTMEVAYRDMSEPRSRLLHGRVAEALERQASDPAAAAGQIAYHLARSSEPRRAAPYALQAGQRAASLGAWAEAAAFYQQALEPETDGARRTALLIALAEAHFHGGDFARATDTYRQATELAQARGDWASLEDAHLRLNQTYLPQARYAEAITQGETLRRLGPPELAVCAEFMWGTGLGIESARPAEAEQHLREAERLLQALPPGSSQVRLAQIQYQLAGAAAQQGRGREAVDLYQQALALIRQDENAIDLLRHIMLYNNLAYHLHLLGDPSAGEYAAAGIRLAQARGSMTHLSYLLSTSGEIALTHDDLDLAEENFTKGLALAREVPIPERIAGHLSNLGLVAIRRGDQPLARQRLTDALQQAQAVGARHLEVHIRIWLAPLEPAAEAARLLSEARALAQGGNFGKLIEEIDQLEKALPPA
jgi:DNA-binding SARP family transcriptional activator/predicted ATPase